MRNVPLSTLCVLVYVIVLLAPFVICKRDPRQVCGGKGFYNTTDKLCTCISGFHGSNCQYRHCPFGKSWFATPIYSDIREQPYTPCSDMGYCNPLTGDCLCRDGYDGRACERLSCPTSGFVLSNKFLDLNNIEVGPASGALVSSAFEGVSVGIPPCSGHGVCKSLREAGQEFNGYSLIKAPISYDSWDADKIQGCLCDYGWEGHDCQYKSCPKGRDPSKSEEYKEAVFVLQCKADAGFFSIFILGSHTPPIPYDADVAYLKYAFETIYAVGAVTVTMSDVDASPLPATVCGSDIAVSTEIRFDSYVGDRPPILVSKLTSNTRMWPQGGTALTLNNGESILRMSTDHSLVCPQMSTGFSGKVYFTYLNSVSPSVDITTSGAAASVKAAVNKLDDLTNAKWTNMEVKIIITGGGGDFLCSTAGAQTTKISILSDYGNIPSIGILDGSYFRNDGVTQNRNPGNFTFTDNAGNGTLYTCSNNGICNHKFGTCLCKTLTKEGELRYQAVSSDGQGGPGDRGDCGYISQNFNTPKTCIIGGKSVCGIYGFCNNETNACECYDGFFGLTCDVRACPSGRALFDEPSSSNNAHAIRECSNNGICDRNLGFCKCRKGWIGQACDVKDCPRIGASGEACSGHGSCVSMSRWYQMHGLTYGNYTHGYITEGSSTWDAFSFRECVCSAKLSAGYGRVDPYRASIGPSSVISGHVATSTPLPGWSNYDCSLRNCPKGDTVNKRTHGNNYATNNLEVQRVVCTADVTNTTDFFYLDLWGQRSDRIYATYDGVQIARAIAGGNKHIGIVSVYFLNWDYDGVSTACNASSNTTDGGFYVQFDTEYGDLPLMTPYVPWEQSLAGSSVDVYEHKAGNSSNLECGGSAMGFCDRVSGLCKCSKHQMSSNGTYSPGAVGDCSYFNPYASATDEAVLWGNIGDEQNY